MSNYFLKPLFRFLDYAKNAPAASAIQRGEYSWLIHIKGTMQEIRIPSTFTRFFQIREINLETVLQSYYI